MSDLNVWSFTGRLGKDPEMNYTDNGLAVTRFSVAVGGWNSKEKSATATWANCVCFGALGERVNTYFRKGTGIAASGSIELRRWSNENGSGTSLDVVVQNITVTAQPKNGGSGIEGEHTTSGKTVVTEVMDSEGNVRF